MHNYVYVCVCVCACVRVCMYAGRIYKYCIFLIRAALNNHRPQIAVTQYGALSEVNTALK